MNPSMVPKNRISTNGLAGLTDTRPCQVVSVEWMLQWAYVREKVQFARLPGLGESPGFAPRGMPSVSSSERIGAAVGTSMNLGFEAPADAYAVKGVVDALTADTKWLVYEHALIGARPDWTPRPQITYRRGGVQYRRDGKGRLRVDFYVIVWVGDLPEVVAERRRAYLLWARGVKRLHAELSRPGVLRHHRLLNDLPPLQPWAQITP